MKRDEIVTGSWDHTIRVWSLNACKRVLKGHSSWVTCLLLMPDEERLVSGSADQTIRVWDVSTGECEHILLGHTSWITCTTLLDKRQMLVASGSSDSRIKIWDLRKGKRGGKCLRTFECQANWITCLEVAVNTHELVSGFRDGRIKVWNLRGQSQEIRKYLGGV